MKTRRIPPALWIATLALAMAPALLRAQDEQTQPSTGVARVSLINGDVSTQRGDTGDWVATSVNAPLVPGDHIATGDNSRTEVQLDYADVMRLDQRSEAKIADLTRSRIQVQLAQGNMDFSVFNNGQAAVEIDTPNVAVQPSGEGVYRIQVNGDETQVIVRQGTAQISTPQGSTNVKAGDLITIEGTDNPQYQVSNAPGRDAWDDWNRDRDNAILNAQSYSHTNHYYTGAQDLDRSGHWVNVPGYDWCWTPYVDAGWVPYRDGRWVWEPGWGWTWVSYESWGWAPYHYGRWFYYGNDWCWWPGYVTPVYYPYWAPAYVGFIGFGYGHFSFGFGFGSIGWLPLGPHDHFHPWYGHGNSYTQVNITNITNITNVNNGGHRPQISNYSGAFTNSHIRGAITTVSSEDFANGRSPRHMGTIDVAQLRQGSVIQGTLPVVPTRQSLSPGTGPARVPAVAQSGAGSRTFFTRNKPPAQPRSFEQHATQIQQMVQKGNTLQSGRPAAAGQAGTASTTGRSAGAPARAVQTNSAPAAANSVNGRTVPSGRAPAENTQTARPGWSRFGASAAPASTSTPRVSGTQGGASSSTARPQTVPRSAPAASGNQTASPGWKQFGAPESRPAKTSSVSPRQAAPRSSQPATSSSSSPRQVAPRSSQPATKEAPKSPERPAPAKKIDNPSRSSNWRGFSGRASAQSRAAPAGETTQPGWSRFSTREPAPRSERANSGSQSERPAYRPEPRSYSRPPLEIRKPIVQERAPQSYGNSNRGSWGNRGASPSRSSSPRVSRGGGGGGRSAPARSSNSSGGHRGGGGRRH
jgi:Family of unknown function (DUF6600)/FecR protein